METIKPKRKIKWGRLIGGAGVIALALTCAGADIYNNAVFAWDKSPVIAVAFVVAGFGLAWLPAMVNDWRDLQIWLLVAVCGLLSLFAGYQNHMVSQRNHDLAQTATTQRYALAHAAIKAADDDLTAAKAEIDNIKETIGGDELQRLYDEAKATEDKEAKENFCGNRCKAARAEAKVYLERLAAARAKEAAQQRAGEAQQRMEREKAGAPTQARASGVSAEEERVMAVLLLLLTIGGATLTHRGCQMIKEAFVTIAPALVPKVKAIAKPIKKPAAQPAANLESFIENCVRPSGGPPLAASEFRGAMETWWRCNHQGKPVPSARALGLALGNAGFERVKKGGNWRYYAKLEKFELKAVG